MKFLGAYDLPQNLNTNPEDGQMLRKRSYVTRSDLSPGSNAELLVASMAQLGDCE